MKKQESDTPIKRSISFQGKDILLERPENMTFQEYKILRKIQNTAIKMLTKGRSPDKNIARVMPINNQQYVRRINQTKSNPILTGNDTTTDSTEQSDKTV